MYTKKSTIKIAPQLKRHKRKPGALNKSFILLATQITVEIRKIPTEKPFHRSNVECQRSNGGLETFMSIEAANRFFI